MPAFSASTLRYPELSLPENKCYSTQQEFHLSQVDLDAARLPLAVPPTMKGFSA